MNTFFLISFGSILYLYRDQWIGFFLTLDRILYINYKPFPPLKSLVPIEQKYMEM